MKIAVLSDTPGLNGKVPALFSQSPCLLIVNAETGELLHATTREEGADGQDIAFAREILRWDCEGVLCGPIEREPFIIIADEGCVTRYDASGMAVMEALERMNMRSLELIRDHIGGEGCQGEHNSGSSACECGHHHEDV